MKKQHITEQSKPIEVIKRLLQETAPIWWVLLICAIVDVLAIVTSIYGPTLLSDLINAIYDFGVHQVPIANAEFLTDGLMLIGVYAIAGVCSVITMFVQNAASTLRAVPNPAKHARTAKMQLIPAMTAKWKPSPWKLWN